MIITIELPEDVASQIERLAAHEGQDITSYLGQLAEREAQIASLANGATMQERIEAANRRPIPQSLDEISPRRIPPPGKTPMQMVYGQWPGDETTEELLEQLARLG